MKRLLAIIFAVGAFWMVTQSWAGGYKAPAIEVLALPKFCWGQYHEEPMGPEFYIRDCGVLMNHYCPGLLMINKAPKAKTSGERKQWLGRGLADTEYTLRGMKDYPSCPIRSHVEATFSRVRRELGLPPVLMPVAPTTNRGLPAATTPNTISPQVTAPGLSDPSATVTDRAGPSREVGGATSASPQPPPPATPGSP